MQPSQLQEIKWGKPSFCLHICLNLSSFFTISLPYHSPPLPLPSPITPLPYHSPPLPLPSPITSLPYHSLHPSLPSPTTPFTHHSPPLPLPSSITPLPHHSPPPIYRHTVVVRWSKRVLSHSPSRRKDDKVSNGHSRLC